jgi:hypothetical protein
LTSTFLTLFVIPVVYTLLDDLRGKFRGKKPAELPPEAEAVPVK